MRWGGLCHAALPYTALPRRGPARPAGRQNAIEYREEYIDGDGDDETKLEEIPCSYCTKITKVVQLSILTFCPNMLEIYF